MNSEYDKKFSLDEITEMNRPIVKTVRIPEDEWEEIIYTLEQIQTLTDSICREKKAMESAAKEFRETAKSSLSRLTETYDRLVGKASEKAASRIERQRIMDDLLWGLRLALMAIPMISVLALAAYMGWFR